MIVPVRGLPAELSATSKFTTPFPLPEAGDVTVSQLSLATTDQEQPVEVMLKLPLPLAIPKFCAAGDMVCDFSVLPDAIPTLHDRGFAGVSEKSIAVDCDK